MIFNYHLLVLRHLIPDLEVIGVKGGSCVTAQVCIDYLFFSPPPFKIMRR